MRVWSCLRQRREMVSCRLGRLKCSVVNMAVHEWSCLSGLSVDEFQDLLTQSGQVLKAKTFNRCVILLVGLDGPTLMKKNYEMGIGSIPLSRNGRITQNSFWACMSEATQEARDWPSSNFFWKNRGFFCLYENYVFSPVPFLCMIFAEITFCPSINLE